MFPPSCWKCRAGADQPAHKRAGWEQRAAAHLLPWHPPSAVLGDWGWVSRGWMTPSQGHATSLPLCAVGALSRWVWGSAAGTYFFRLCRKPLLSLQQLGDNVVLLSIAVGEGDGGARASWGVSGRNVGQLSAQE